MNRHDEQTEARHEFSLWWLLVVGLILVTGIVIWSLDIPAKIIDTRVDRMVFEESHQYQEARKSEIATFEAQLAEIDSQLSDPNLDGATRRNLKAQRASINVQLRAAKEKTR